MRPPGTDRTIIAQSQLRCVEKHNLIGEKPAKQVRLSVSELSDRTKAIQHIIDRSSQRIRSIRSIAKEAGYCVLISDADGVIVEQISDSQDAKFLSDKGLKCGTVWREEYAGTNAISMAMLSGETFTVSGNDHFFQSFAPFMCTAAPILDHMDSLIGTIDLSGVDTENQEHLAFVRFAVSQSTAGMQADMFLHHYRGDLILRLDDGKNTSPNALVAVGSNGQIAGMTRRASHGFLTLDPPLMLGKPLTDLMDADVDTLMEAIGKRLQVDLASNGQCTVIPLTAPQNAKPAGKSYGVANYASPVIGARMRKSGIIPLSYLAGSDPVMRENVALCQRLAAKAIPIILQGETGVGKDALAKSLHFSSDRANKPFIAVNCAATPESMIDSELFGYAPGTFTGGLRQGKEGKIAASSGGTLMLDEIGDMPLELQGRLLRVLAEREVTPLGAVNPIPVDINITCATNKNLGELIRNGKFREDLYYRLNGARVRIPSLRERNDLPNIIQSIANGQANRVVAIHDDAMQMMLAYPWPGNVRQLINALRYALACGDGDNIKVTDFPIDILESEDITPSDHPSSAHTLNDTLSETERRTLRKTLERNEWHISKAARSLGISRATIHRKMTTHGISRPVKTH